jgi:RTX calcium-binding nonapeptide repeat (4 copies)/Beta-propeller repeat
VAEQTNTFQQVYTPGSDLSAASEVGQLIWGRTGNDLILGFQKVNPGLNPLQVDYLLGDVAVDDPQGRQWRDTFILGDWQKPYYANAPFSLYGLNEYAIVTDFNPQLDRIQVFGNANNYRTLNVSTGTLLLLQKPTGLDVVAFFLGTQSLNLKASYFEYKGNISTPRVEPRIKQVGTAGNDTIVSISASSDGSIYQAGGTTGSIVGGTSNNESRDAALIKYNADGTVAWQKQFGTGRYDTIYDVKTDAQGNVFTLGLTFGNLAATKSGDVSDVFLRKYNSAGQELWTRQFGDTVANNTVINSAFSLDFDASGNVYVAGLSARNGQGSALPVDNFWVTRFDTNGNRQWYNEFGTSDYDEPYALAVSNDGSVYAAGWSFSNFGGANSAQGSYDGAIAKLNSQGQVQWQRNLGTSDYEWIWGVDTDSQNNLYVSGWTLGAFPGNTNAGAADAFLAKYDKDGNRLWVKQFGTAGDDQAFRMAIDANDNIFITGYTDSNLGGTNAGSTDAWVARYDTSGNRAWIRQFGSAEAEQGNGITVNSTGVYVSGITQGSLGATNAGSFDSWVAKLSLSGNLLSFGAAAPATSTASTYAVGNTGGNATVTDSLAVTILSAVFGSFLLQQNLPGDSGGATGVNIEDLLRNPIFVPGIPNGMLTTTTSALSFNALNSLTSALSVQGTTRATRSTAKTKTLDRTDNVFQGSDTNEIVNGRGGDDRIAGLGGSDILKGGAGDDRLIGGKGQDRIVGGEGADLFVLGSNSTDRIADFDFAEGDRIALRGSLTFEQLTLVQGIGVNASSTLVQRGNDVLAVLEGVQASQLTQSAFV